MIMCIIVVTIIIFTIIGVVVAVVVQLSSTRLDEQEMAENLTLYIQGRVNWACLSASLLFILLSSL